MLSFDQLVAQAESADVTGWSFAWLDGRATEERPPWGYSRLLADRLNAAQCALDIDTGGGEVVAEAPHLPNRMFATEGWSPNRERARKLLGPRGVQVVASHPDQPLPFPDTFFDLVTARHPIEPRWTEIHRVLQDGGRYFAQHVSTSSPPELREYFMGRWAGEPIERSPDFEVAAAENAGLTVDDVRRARCRMELYDIGAVVWILRKCVWWVPDFSVARYDSRLRELDDQLRRGEPFVAHSGRHLIEAHRG